MHPAFSVIFFTVLSGAGYGLWFWIGLRCMSGPHPSNFGAWAWIPAWVLGFVLIVGGLLSSTAHLGKPLRSWRAFSQWRTSWLSREGVLAVASFAPVLTLLLLLRTGQFDIATRIVAATLALLAIATVICTAMIYASLKPIPAWRHRLVVPGYLLFALLTGGLPMLLSSWPGAHGIDGAMPHALTAIAIALLALKLIYWRDIDRTPLPQTRGDAIGLPQRTPSVFERPHTEANYITREMAFAVARRHARMLRIAAVLLFALVPLLCLLLAWPQPGAVGGIVVASACALAGALLERWLFFAQARHLVTLYY